MSALLGFLCSHPETEWAAARDAMRPECFTAVVRELAALGLVDDAGPTTKGRRLAAVSQAALRAYDAAGGFSGALEGPQAAGGASAGPRVRDFDTWTAARREAFAAAGLDCRTPLAEFLAATVSAAVSATWANCRIFGGTKRGPQCVRVPRAEFWPGGVYPAGMVVVDEPAETEARQWGKRGQSQVSNEGYEGWQQAWADREGYARRLNADGEGVGPWLKAGEHAPVTEQPELLAAD